MNRMTTDLCGTFSRLSLFACSFAICFNFAIAGDVKGELFDMDAIGDASTLDVEVIQDWHRVDAEIPSRQKLVTINVGEIWPGQEYRIPVRLVAPADRKARGFHLTGGNFPEGLKQDTKLSPLDRELIQGGVGLVYTVVQVPERSGLAEVGRKSEARFLKTLNPHDKIQYWAWPATMMRAVTTAYAESDHFEVGKVAMSGGSKNGATPSMAILHDRRMTAVQASVSPIWDSPLRLCDRQAWDELESVTGPLKHAFLGGHFGPILTVPHLITVILGKTFNSLPRTFPIAFLLLVTSRHCVLATLICCFIPARTISLPSISPGVASTIRPFRSI